jgi:ankyrin repeat protein
MFWLVKEKKTRQTLPRPPSDQETASFNITDTTLTLLPPEGSLPSRNDTSRSSSISEPDSALFDAIRGRDLEGVKASIKNGANTLAEQKGWLAIHYCAKHGSKRILLAVIEAGTPDAVVNARDKAGKTPLHIAAELGSVEVGKILLQRGAEHHAKDEDGDTPLDMANKYHRWDFIAMLNDRG